MSENEQKIIGIYGNSRDYLLAGMAGITGGALAAAVTMRQEFYDDISHVSDIKDQFDTLRTSLHKKWNDWTKPSADTPKMGRAEYFKTIRDEKRETHKIVNKLLDEHGYRTGGWDKLIPGTWDRIRQMSADSRNTIIFRSGLTAAVTAGAVFTFINNRHTRHTLDALVQRLDDKEAKRDR